MHMSKNCDGLVCVVAKQQKSMAFIFPEEWKTKMAAKKGIPEKITDTSANNTILQ